MGVVVMTWEQERARLSQMAALLEAVAQGFGVPADDVRGNSQKPAVVHARYVAAFLLDLVEMLPEDLTALALNRNQKTVIAYADRGDSLLAQDGDVRAKALVAWAAYGAQRGARAPTTLAAGGRIKTDRDFMRWARAALRAAS
jgi:hypothetical protein